MASYKVVFKPSVEKDLRALPQSVVGRVFNKIEALAAEPFPRQSTRLAGAEHLYRIRIGDYHVIYSVDNARKQVIVHYVRHRREVYRRS
jgi:mRNA interferase RelE/StbE